MGKSKAQDALRDEIEQIYPASFVDDELYIGKLVEERGYTMKEIERELGSKPHKMFVDIVMRDSERTVAFEYHGEQHYSLVGNMTRTTADLLVNQQLDREKSWILNRIGVPLVAIPYDMYIDESVIERLIDEASKEMSESVSDLSECPECSRMFPLSQMPQGACKSCVESAREEKAESRKEEEKSRRRESARERARKRKERAQERKKDEPAWKRFSSDGDGGEDEYKEMQKQKAKEYRRKKYEEWKASPEYAAQKEEAKRRRKEAYQKMKAERKRQGKW